MALKIEDYKDAAGEWRWRIKRNGRIIAGSGEGYKRRGTMLRAVRNMIKALADGDYGYTADEG